MGEWSDREGGKDWIVMRLEGVQRLRRDSDLKFCLFFQDEIWPHFRGNGLGLKFK